MQSQISLSLFCFPSVYSVGDRLFMIYVYQQSNQKERECVETSESGDDPHAKRCAAAGVSFVVGFVWTHRCVSFFVHTAASTDQKRRRLSKS